EMFDFLRGLAIERELVFQTARIQGIELTAEQKSRLEQIRRSLAEREHEESGQVLHLNQSGTLEDEIAFELRDATSRFLEVSLLEKAGAPSPLVTESAVQDYYRAHIK